MRKKDQDKCADDLAILIWIYDIEIVIKHLCGYENMPIVDIVIIVITFLLKK